MARRREDIELMNVRMPAVAGAFYPDDGEELRAMVAGLLAGRAAEPGSGPRAIVAPHAGYVYSGPVAATAFGAVSSRRGEIDRVVVIGPSHRVPLCGLATSSASSFRTPMGDLRVDRAAVDAAERLPSVARLDAAHAREHALEVELPFVLATLGDVPVVPLVAGDVSAEEVADALEALAPDDRTLIVVSSDLSHYLDHDAATARDAATTRAIEALDPGAVADDDACGAVPLRGLLTLARRRGWSARALDVRTSGDTAGPRDEVVGYGAYAFG
jgi:MEMO1 family protein